MLFFLASQTSTLVKAWRWTSADKIPHFLPLHHTHGVINKLSCALWSGAEVDFVPHSAASLWSALTGDHGYTLFMAVSAQYVVLRSRVVSFVAEDGKFAFISAGPHSVCEHDRTL
jgi:malonyl-CoA/methylmalonyl-CoA synthetase